MRAPIRRSRWRRSPAALRSSGGESNPRRRGRGDHCRPRALACRTKTRMTEVPVIVLDHLIRNATSRPGFGRQSSGARLPVGRRDACGSNSNPSGTMASISTSARLHGRRDRGSAPDPEEAQRREHRRRRRSGGAGDCGHRAWRRLDAGRAPAALRRFDAVEAVEKVLAGGLADMVFTDPPYNVNYGATMKTNSGQEAEDRQRQSRPRLRTVPARCLCQHPGGDQGRNLHLHVVVGVAHAAARLHGGGRPLVHLRHLGEEHFHDPASHRGWGGNGESLDGPGLQ